MLRSGVAVAVVALFATLPATAPAHQGNPNFSSQIDAVTPRVPGVEISVVNGDDRFLLRNRSAETVVVYGYEDEPYARIRPDGTVEVNTDSSAYYLNEDRFGGASVPPGVDSRGPPRWKVVSRAGRFDWHDHRMHWMAEGRRPPQVTDPSQRTRVFGYRVPIEVGGRSGAIAGTLFWIPTPGGDVPLGAILAFAAIVVAVALAVFVVRHRRRATPDRREAAEAW